MNDALGLDLPERLVALGAHLAGAVDRAVQRRRPAVLAHSLDRGEPRAVAEQHADALDEAGREAVVQHQLVGEDRVAGRLDQDDVARA
ncbi:MAG: hypothetical protein R3C69_14770 [Geminicoccaceae bacterium]